MQSSPAMAFAQVVNCHFYTSSSSLFVIPVNHSLSSYAILHTLLVAIRQKLEVSVSFPRTTLPCLSNITNSNVLSAGSAFCTMTPLEEELICSPQLTYMITCCRLGQLQAHLCMRTTSWSMEHPTKEQLARILRRRAGSRASPNLGSQHDPTSADGTPVPHVQPPPFMK